MYQNVGKKLKLNINLSAHQKVFLLCFHFVNPHPHKDNVKNKLKNNSRIAKGVKLHEPTSAYEMTFGAGVRFDIFEACYFARCFV